VNKSIFNPVFLSLSLVSCLFLLGCSKPKENTWQGYLEGDFVYISSPLAGRLDKLAVVKGQYVNKSDLLFSLESENEQAAQNQASAELAMAKAKLADAKKGLRPSELASIEARLGLTKASAELAHLDLIRQEQLYKEKVISQSEYDRARLNYEANTRSVEQAGSDLKTASLGSRIDLIQAALAQVQASEASKKRADWSLEQKVKKSPAAALVYDTLYREGEFVGSGMPIIMLLPPENLKIRFFVTEESFGKLKAGDKLKVSLSTTSEQLSATLSYFSPQSEYTPPVLFNRDNRAKLVFMCEALFNQAPAGTLHPGQPVDISLSQ